MTPPPPIVTHFSTKALVLLSQNPRYPLPPKTVTSLMDDPFARLQLLLQVLLSLSTASNIEKPCQLLLLCNFVVRFCFFKIIIYTSPPPVLNHVTPENVNEKYRKQKCEENVEKYKDNVLYFCLFFTG